MRMSVVIQRENDLSGRRSAEEETQSGGRTEFPELLEDQT